MAYCWQCCRSWPADEFADHDCPPAIPGKRGFYTEDDVSYCVERLHQLTRHLAEETIPIVLLTTELYADVWNNESSVDVEDDLVSPAMVLEAALVDSFHYRRILSADLHFPILVAASDRSGGRLRRLRAPVMIIDGYHRFAQATKDGRRTILVVQVTPEVLELSRVIDTRDVEDEDHKVLYAHP